MGTLEGALLVFGGVYSNWQALESMQQAARQLGIPPERILCTGDVVGYCADPEACVQAIRQWGIHVIAGNVEIQLREGQDDCGCDFDSGSRCDLFSRRWYPFAKEQLSQESINWMQELPDFLKFSYAGMNGVVVHGSWQETAGYVFNSSPWPIKQQTLDAGQAELVLAGHCGLPFSQEHQGQYWLNPGVIGMPANDGSARVWYMLLDNTEGLRFEHRPLEYNYRKAAIRMEVAGLPSEYARTLRTGLWDNCEILPEEETALQGKRIIC